MPCRTVDGRGYVVAVRAIGLLVALMIAALGSACGGAAPERTPSPVSRDAVVSIVGRVGQETVRGTGVVIDADRRLVLTTAHRVWGARSLRLGTSRGRVVGRIVAASRCSDLAVVQAGADLRGLGEVRFGSARALRVGERLSTLGFAWPGEATTGERLERAARRPRRERRCPPRPAA